MVKKALVGVAKPGVSQARKSGPGAPGTLFCLIFALRIYPPAQHPSPSKRGNMRQWPKMSSKTC